MRTHQYLFSVCHQAACALVWARRLYLQNDNKKNKALRFSSNFTRRYSLLWHSINRCSSVACCTYKSLLRNRTKIKAILNYLLQQNRSGKNVLFVPITKHTHIEFETKRKISLPQAPQGLQSFFSLFVRMPRKTIGTASISWFSLIDFAPCASAKRTFSYFFTCKAPR